MIIIYNKEKQKVQELVDKILQEHPEYGEVRVISDLSELPEDVKTDADSKVISDFVGDLAKHFEDVVEKPSAEDLIRAHVETYYNTYYIPEVPNIEEFVKENKTDFQKLSSFNRKEKNQARKKLEHQALKYRNKHWKK